MRPANTAVRLLLLAVATAVVSMPQANRPASAVLQQVRSHHQGIAVWWVGNDGQSVLILRRGQVARVGLRFW